MYRLPAGARAGAGPDGPGRGVLLTAARTAARTGGPAVPPAGARYWLTRSQVGNFLRVGPRGHPYAILEKASDQRWYARAPQGPSPDLTQNLGVQFASAADAAAWRRDGSPASWPVGQDTSVAQPTGAANGSDSRIAAGRGRLTLGEVFFGPAPFSFGGGPLLSAAGLRALPADPARLRNLILRGWNRFEGVDREEYLFEFTPGLLTLPVTPAVRAALYRMLASLPGVKSLGPVTDAGGRAGVAVALTGRYSGCGQESVLHRDGGTEEYPAFASCTVEQRLVIDPASGMPLAQELRYAGLPPGQHWSAPDGLFSFQLFQAAGWTAASPPES
ncbi:MAG TPA: CU044_5270 family protein, partial [Streptosporangiaceae bacterium]|nr:CU044_5270 family protein [Streptosporangiaceae bacterium]